MAKKTYTARPIDRLWGALRGWAIVYLLATGALVAATGYRFSLLAVLPSDMGMTEMDILPGGDLEMVTTITASLVWVLAYFVAAFLTLKWYYRATRNAHALTAGCRKLAGVGAVGLRHPVHLPVEALRRDQ